MIRFAVVILDGATVAAVVIAVVDMLNGNSSVDFSVDGISIFGIDITDMPIFYIPIINTAVVTAIATAIPACQEVH